MGMISGMRKNDICTRLRIGYFGGQGRESLNLDLVQGSGSASDAL